MTALAQYYCKVGISVDNAQLKKVDMYLRQVEKRLADFQKRMMTKNGLFNINFKLNTSRLEFDVQKAFIEVGKRVKFPIERFVVNKEGLRTQVATAIREAISSVNKNIILNAKVNQPKSTPSGSGATNRSQASVSRANFLHAGGAGGAIARYGVGSLPFIGGVYGLSSLNKANQELISSQIAAESVFGSQGKQMTDWFRQQSEYVGFDYLQNLPTFTKFMASSMPLMGGDASKDVFSSFLQFGRTRGATEVSMNRALNAVSQMAAKGQIMQEELKGQLAEAGGFGELPQLFAEAYQMQTGGSLTGAEARAALMDAMQKGQVKSASILPLVSQLMNQLSAGGIEAARKSSTAEQARLSNTMTKLLETFSKSGGEEAFSRIFRTMSEALRESEGIVVRMTSGFNSLTKSARELLLFPQSFVRFFEGRDSLVGDMLFPTEEQKAGAFIFLENFKSVLDEMNKLLDLSYQGWQKIIDLLSSDNAIKALSQHFSTVSNGLGSVNAFLGGDFRNAGQLAKQAGGQYLDYITTPGKVGANALIGAVNYGAQSVGMSGVNIPKFDVLSGDAQALAQQQAGGANKTTSIMFGDINVQMPTSADGTSTPEQAKMFANMIQLHLQDAMSAYTRK